MTNQLPQVTAYLDQARAREAELKIEVDKTIGHYQKGLMTLPDLISVLIEIDSSIEEPEAPDMRRQG